MYKYYFSEEQKALYGSELVLVNNEWVEYTVLAWTLYHQTAYEMYYKDIKVITESEKRLPTKRLEDKKQFEIKNITSINLINSTTGETEMSINPENTNIHIQLFKKNDKIKLYDMVSKDTNKDFKLKIQKIKEDIDRSLRYNDKELFMKLTSELNHMLLEV